MYTFLRSVHADVNVFEDLARGDAQNAIGRFHEVIALTAGVLATERVREAETETELFSFDEKSGAIGFPLGGLHGFVLFEFLNLQLQRTTRRPMLAGWPCLLRLICFSGSGLLFSFCEGEGDSTREWARGQFSIFGAIEEKEVCEFLAEYQSQGNLK